MSSAQSDIVIAVFAGTLILLLLASFGIIFTLIHKKKQQANKKEKELMQTQFQHAILQTKVEIQEQTFKNISQEIHDNIGQVLSLAKLNLSSFPVENDPGLQTKIDETKNLISKALHDLRDLSRSLHGDKIAELGLQDSINAELKILQNTGQYQTSLSITGAQFRMEAQKEMVLFRMVQEAMNNAIKHSKAKHIDIMLDYKPDIFRLSVTDDGIGFDPTTLQTASTGIGLRNMQDRAEMIGAVFSLCSGPGNGTQVNVELSVPLH